MVQEHQMLRNKVAFVVAVVVIAAVGYVGVAYSQDTRPAAPAAGGSGPGVTVNGQKVAPQTWTPEQIKEWQAKAKQQMSEYWRKQLDVSEDEWKVLGPKLENVQTLSNQVRYGAMYGGNMAVVIPGAQGEQPKQSDLQKSSADLRTLLQNKDSKPEDIKKALTAYRDAREKAKQQLAAAQKELRELLTVRQEAQLVTMGTLD
jgi:hypothetical protein